MFLESATGWGFATRRRGESTAEVVFRGGDMTETSRPLLLAVHAEADGAWRVSVGVPGTRLVEGRLGAADVAAILARVAPLGQLPAVVIPGRDAPRTRAEEAAGRALGGVLRVSHEVASHFAFCLGRSQASGRAIVAVDARDAAIRGLPWELIAPTPDGPPLEAARLGAVIRLGGLGNPWRAGPAAGHLAVCCWAPGSDAATRSLVTALQRTVAPLGTLTVVDQLARAASPILHLICHGRREVDEVALLLGDGDAGADTVTHLAATIRGAALVVLDVCEAAAATSSELDNLAGRLIAAGAAACVAPAGRCSVEAASAFSLGLYTALAEGLPLASAVAAGRVGVRGLARAHPDSRWYNHRLYVGDVAAAAEPVVIAGWEIPGWPRCAPEVLPVLAEARQLSIASGLGFLGVEHLAFGIERCAGGGRAAARVRFSAAARRAAIVERTGGLVGGGADLAATPRLTALAGRVASGFDIESLSCAILSDERGEIADALPGTGAVVETLRPGQQTDVALGFEVLGGPEDGRRLAPRAGDVVGRASVGGPDLGLYRADVSDPRLSRRHLRWEGGGVITALSPVRVISPDTETAVSAGTLMVIAVGDIVVLSRATRLRAIGEPD